MDSMKQLLLGLACSMAFPLAAQRDLFPLGQRSYFQDMSLPGIQVGMVLMDTTITDLSGGTVLHNKGQFRRAVLGDCSMEGTQQLDPLADHGWVMDSLLVRNDTVFFFSAYSTTPFYFLPKAAVGQSWTVTSSYTGNDFSDILITCASASEVGSGGFTDSVKVFSMDAVGAVSPLDDLQFRLSKAHGLMEYVPFAQLLYHPAYASFSSRALVGWKTATTSFGYQQPDFMDYFLLAPGDVLLWEHYHDPGWITQGPPYWEYMRDSITGTLITPDSIVYTYDQVYSHEDGSITEQYGRQVVYRRSEFEGFVAAAPNDFAMVEASYQWMPETIWRSGLLELEISSACSDTATSIELTTYGSLLDPTWCVISDASDISQTYRFNTRVGLEGSWNWLNPSDGYTKIIAYEVGCSVLGDVNMGVDRPKHPGKALSIYPNPATGRLFVDGPWRLGRTFIILDGLGRVVQSGAVPAGGISVQHLPNGLYLLRIPAYGAGELTRFVKE